MAGQYVKCVDLTLKAFPKGFPPAMGTFGTIFDIGHATKPILAGVLLASHGYLFSFSLMGSLLLVAAPVFLLTVKTEHT